MKKYKSEPFRIPFRNDRIRDAVADQCEWPSILALRNYCYGDVLSDADLNKISFMSIEIDGFVFRIASRTKYGVELNMELFKNERGIL